MSAGWTSILLRMLRELANRSASNAVTLLQMSVL